MDYNFSCRARQSPRCRPIDYDLDAASEAIFEAKCVEKAIRRTYYHNFFFVVALQLSVSARENRKFKTVLAIT